jgi:hypothetical protein
VVRHVDELGRAEQRESGAEEDELALERQPGEPGSDREGGDVDRQKEPGGRSLIQLP